MPIADLSRCRAARRCAGALALLLAASLVAPLGANADPPPSYTVTSDNGAYPVRVIVDFDYADIPLFIDNPGAGISNARVDVAITGPSDTPAADVGMQFRSGIWLTAGLHGNADQPGGISGYFGPPSGSNLQSGKSTYYTRIRFEPGTPTELLNLDYTINTVDQSDYTKVTPLAHKVVQVQTVQKTTPKAPDASVVATAGVAQRILLHPTNADGYGPAVTHTDPQHGTLTQDSPNQGEKLTYTPAKGFTGTDTFTYTASGAPSVERFEPGPSATGTVTVAVKGLSAIHTVLSPGPSMVGQHPRLTVQVASVGTVDGGRVTVGGLAHPLSARLSHGALSFSLPALAAGQHRLPVSFAGTATAYPATYTITDTVNNYATRLTASSRPTHVTSRTAHPTVLVAVHPAGGSTHGATVTVLRGSQRLGRAFVRSGHAVVLLPRQKTGRHTYRVVYSGTASTVSVVKTFHETVAR